MYQWPSRRSSTSTVNNSTKFTPVKPPPRPSTTPPAPARPPRHTPSFGAAFIQTTPPPKSPAQLRAALDPARIGPLRMPSYVGSLLDAFSIDSIGETSLDLDRSFEVSPRASYRDPLLEEPPTTTISEESRIPTAEHATAPSTEPFEGLQLTLSLPERPFSMGVIPHFQSRSPSPASRPHSPAPRRVRLDSAAFEKPPQSFSTPMPHERLRRKSCLLDCVRKGVKRAVRKL